MKSVDPNRAPAAEGEQLKLKSAVGAHGCLGQAPAIVQSPANSRDFAEFYRSTLVQLRRYLMGLIGCKMEAQDLAHDAYARVYPAMGAGQVGSPQAFLYTTARRLAINHLRHRDRAQTQSAASETLDENPAADPGVPQTVMAREELAHLEQALAQLPPGCRAVLLLRKVELLSHKEIAQRLGITRSTVEKQQVRAVRLLREALDACGAAHAPGNPAPPVSSGWEAKL